jgi:hypothetical protein
MFYDAAYLTQSEEELLRNEDALRNLSQLLYVRQFSLDFLAKTVEWYDSWLCLRSQKGLTPEFCFRYLFDNGTDSADNWTDYNDIAKYFLNSEMSTAADIEAAFQAEMARRTK